MMLVDDVAVYVFYLSMRMFMPVRFCALSITMIVLVVCIMAMPVGMGSRLVDMCQIRAIIGWPGNQRDGRTSKAK